MPHWLIKSALHRVISWLPNTCAWDAWLHRLSGSLRLGVGAFEGALGFHRRHLNAFLQWHPEGLEGAHVLELGTGWHPVQPIACYLAGAAEVWTFDIAPLVTADYLRTTLQHFCDLDANGRLGAFLPCVLPERVRALREALSRVDRSEPVEVLAPLGIHLRHGDARSSERPAGSVDFVFSQSVLEYIPRPVLAELLAEFHRVAKPRAVMSHYIRMADQYHHFDKRLTPLNFLRFSERSWRWLDSSLLPQNRLRISDFRTLISEAGFRLTTEECTRAAADDLEKIKVATEFQGRSEEDLLVIGAWVAALAEK
jgi:SAM-dependent methyltransferase